jgi:hypothetical protein
MQAAVIVLEAYGISRGHLEEVDPLVPMIIGRLVFSIGGVAILAIVAAQRNWARRRQSRRAD